jgi:hypothetical protein
MRKIVVALAALAFLAPSSAHAIAFVGARVGYAMPSGDAQTNQPIKDTVSSAVPVQVDAGLSFFNILSVGAYGSYGALQFKSDFKNTCASCSGSTLRAGVQVNLRPPVVLKELWGGVFAGYEQMKASGGRVDTKMSGWEAGLQAGWDFSILPFIGIGPYASYSVAQFTSISGAPTTSTAQHQAFTIGLRGIFDL